MYDNVLRVRVPCMYIQSNADVNKIDVAEYYIPSTLLLCINSNLFFIPYIDIQH